MQGSLLLRFGVDRFAFVGNKLVPKTALKAPEIKALLDLAAKWRPRGIAC